ncbi:nickel/cobalt transporter [Cardiobacteriaceae bacterium TAE3-ERU3]|nr:nickel/cobalt transporter [Cardiobacteriaceae bacterium TAE3-ERU3]
MPVSRKWLWLGIAAVVLLCVIFAADIHQLWRELLFYVQREQNSLRREITKSLSALRQGGDPAAWWGMVSLGFVYGVLHAVGPGHGKAVVSTFLLTQPSGYKSALGLAVGGALLQGVSAILWVSVTLGLMQWLIREAVGQVIWAERFSYTLIIVAGAYIVWRQWRRLRQPDAACGCGHDHHHNHSEHEHAHNHIAGEVQHCCSNEHHHECQHGSDDAENNHQHCDHYHHNHGEFEALPTSSRRTHLLAMLAIGARPCSGAILALAVAAGWGLWGVGIAMTFAMALGTAITVLSLALLTVFGRERLALSLSQGSTHWQKAFNILVIVGGLILVALGVVMLMASGGSNGALPRV